MLRGFAGSGPSRGGFARSGPVFGFREAVADSLDLATEHTGAKEGAIGPANQVRRLSGWVSPNAADSSRNVRT